MNALWSQRHYTQPDKISDVAAFATAIRADALKMVGRAKASHIGSALSIADIVAILYGQVLALDPQNPEWPDRDRFILSKGHACVAIYAALANRGFIPHEALETYGNDGSTLMAHISHKVAGVEFSTGALGHGLSFGVGKALAAKRQHASWRTFVLMSDGEMGEGSNWEALMFAAHHKLNNLCAIIDYNKLQSLGTVEDTVALEPLRGKLEAFGWAVCEVDGHDHAALSLALDFTQRREEKPTVVIAHTIKGKGVPFMENQVAWHYRSPDQQQLADALVAIGAASDA